ncbi:PH domain-containing protein, partial [Candidatus Micrarchaeota archaeon]|nr:PH domain-containing protein [Candidatus Micrarchaeota archaeon]
SGLGILTLAIWLLVISLLISILSYLWSDLQYRSFQYELTNTELILKSGFLSRNNVVLPYEKIKDVSIARGSLANQIERLLGIFTLKIETTEKKTIELPGVSDPMDKIRLIMRNIQEKQIKKDDVKPIIESSTPTLTEEIDNMQQVLEELKSIKKLLEENKLVKKKKNLESIEVEKDKLNILTKLTKSKSKTKK